MARKHKHPEHENLERWLVSYADFMTLLFATFTALYALAQTDAAKLKAVGAAIKEGFEEQSLINGIKSILEGSSAPNKNPDPISSDKGAGAGIMGKFDSMTYQPGEVKSLQHLVDDLTSDLKQANQSIKTAMGALGSAGQDQSKGGSDGNQSSKPNQMSTEKTEDPKEPIRPIEMGVQQRGVRISFDSRMLFDAGSATLKPAGEKFLDVVAARLKKFDNKRIHVEGHTDNQAISTGLFPSNWELSTARASSVVRYLIGKHDFNPGSMVAVGYADTQPISNNATPEGRSKNRRVDIILYSDKSSNLMNPRTQFIGEQPVNTVSSNPEQVKNVIPILPKDNQDGPVRVIIKDKDGTERILVPKTHELVPLEKADALSQTSVKPVTVRSAPAKPAASPRMMPKPVEAVPKGPPIPGGGKSEDH
jgi:chemotaxis protein MotB